VPAAEVNSQAHPRPQPRTPNTPQAKTKNRFTPTTNAELLQLRTKNEERAPGARTKNSELLQLRTKNEERAPGARTKISFAPSPKTITVTNMVTVSIQDMRFDFAPIKSALDEGEELMLTYRNRPLARLVPVAQRNSASPDPALSFGERTENLEPMSNEEMDRVIYG